MAYHVRRKDREITDADAMRRILKSAKSITIALCMNDEPYLVSLSHGYDDEHNCIYFHCAPEGKKIEYMKANSRVWGQAVVDYLVGCECEYSYTCVHFKGKVTLVDDVAEKRRGLECLIRQLSANPEAKIAKLKPEKIAKTMIGRIDIEYMTGKKTQT
jgi:nitroimidazol reductase NimA-like FMN-containing flavoprotein (pyridoxamine 5'-phosphate oxidase superfamily)